MSQRALELLWRTLANVFIVLLFIVAFCYALLVSYGYRFDPLQIKVLESGIISLNAVTPEADIYLDGQLLPNLQTPTHTPNLSLRTYHVELKKPGFFTWSKNIRVQEEVVTHVGEIKLIPEPSLANQTTYAAADLFAVSSNQVTTYTTAEHTILLFDQNGQEISHLTAPATPLQLTYVNDKLYLQDTENDFWQLLSDETWQISNTPLALTATDPLSPDQTKILLQKSHEIWSKDLKNQTSSLLFRFAQPVTYLTWFSNNQILFEQNNQLRICDQDGQNCVLLAETDALSASPVFVPSTSRLFFLQNNLLRSLNLSSSSSGIFGNFF